MYTREELFRELDAPDIRENPVTEAVRAQVRLHEVKQRYARECSRMVLNRMNRLLREGKYEAVLGLAAEPDLLEGMMRVYQVSPDHIDFACCVVRKALAKAFQLHTLRSEEARKPERRKATTVRTLSLMSFKRAEARA